MVVFYRFVRYEKLDVTGVIYGGWEKCYITLGLQVEQCSMIITPRLAYDLLQMLLFSERVISK